MEKIPFHCPICGELLRADPERHICPSCHQIYSHVLGIPDFCSPGLKASSTEALLVEKLVEIYHRASVEELVDLRLSTLTASSGYVSEEHSEGISQYDRTKYDRGQQFYRAFRSMLVQHLSAPAAGAALDLGCGTGAGIVPLAGDFDSVVGMDISMSALIIAKKLVETLGITNVVLVRATALSLPFADSFFDYCMAINVLEHIFETRKLLSEINRVLTTGGLFSGDSRNRFDLFFPEPHVNIRWLGLLPRSWVRPYVRWRKDIDYDEMHARLLSYRELRSALASTFGDNWLVVIPELSVYGVSGWIKNLVTTLDTIVHPLMIRLSPSHWVLARCHKA